MNDDMDNYEDIIHLPHHESKVRPRMTRVARAAQFSPFTALDGYEAAIHEAGRATESFHPPGYDSLQELNRRMAILCECQHQHPTVTILHFEPDERKNGGLYTSTTGHIRNIDDYNRTVLMDNNRSIPFRYIMDIQGELFDNR